MLNFGLLFHIDRWLLSSNAKDIGVLYLMFALQGNILLVLYLTIIWGSYYSLKPTVKVSNMISWLTAYLIGLIRSAWAASFKRLHYNVISGLVLANGSLARLFIIILVAIVGMFVLEFIMDYLYVFLWTLVGGNPIWRYMSIIILNKFSKLYKNPILIRHNTFNRIVGRSVSGGISKQTVFFEYSPTYKNIKELVDRVNDDEENNRQVQLDIENYLRTSWIDVIKEKNNELITKVGGELGATGFSFLNQYILEFEDIVEEIRRKIKNKGKENKYVPLFELNSADICMCVFKLIIPLIVTGTSMARTDLLIKMGEAVYHIWLLDRYRKSKSWELSVKVGFNEFKDNMNIDIKDIGNIGEILLTEIIDMGDLLVLKIEKKEGTYKGEYVVYPSDTSIEKFEKSFDVVGFKLPMVCEPNPWNANNYGGYLLNEGYHYTHFIHQGNRNFNKTRVLKGEDRVYNQINYMNSVPFKINTNVLDYILNYGVRDGLILEGLHPKTMEKTLESWEKEEVMKHNSRYYLEKNILGIAILFRDVKKIYFPLFFDWRGRIYNDNSYLNYQSNALAKSLLLFAEFRDNDVIYNKEESLDWLKIFGANCFGKGVLKLKDNNYKYDLNRLSYIDRKAWVNSYEKDIIFLNSDFIIKADQPLLFIAFCYEYKLWKTDKEYKSLLPIQLDATCNGIQHLALITANAKLAKLVNLLPSTESDAPNDVYSIALSEINKKIKELVIKESKYINLKKIKLDRKIVKRSIMTTPYNVTIKGVVDHLKSESFVKKIIDKNILYFPINSSNTNNYLTGSDLFALGKIIHSILYETHPELQNVVNYFKDIVSIMNELNLPVVWVTPSGLHINQKYPVKKPTQVKSGFYRGSSYTILLPTDKLNKVAQKSAFMPNLIHSLDGATITLLVNSLKKLGKYNIYTVHDCFASNAAGIGLINELVRKSFFEIYAEKEFLFNLQKFFIEYIGNNYQLYRHGTKEEIDVTNLLPEDITQGNFYVINSQDREILLPSIPKTEGFLDLKDQLNSAIYLIN